MKIYNTLSKQKEEFQPIEEGKVRMYVCGPTVYNYIHIGNARPMIVFDTFRRYMEYKGYDVNYVSNFTDVDDKIIKKAMEEGVSADEVAKRYIAECKQDMESLNVKPATTHPLATEEISGMIEMIQTLIDKGHAYAAEDGTVYYRTRSFPEYGKLSHKNLDDLHSRGEALIPTLQTDALDPADFAHTTCYDGGYLVAKNAGWRNMRPVLDAGKCTACLQCYLYCPDGCIFRPARQTADAAGTAAVAIDYDFCKGCGVCVEVCRFGALAMVPESEGDER